MDDIKSEGQHQTTGSSLHRAADDLKTQSNMKANDAQTDIHKAANDLKYGAKEKLGE